MPSNPKTPKPSTRKAPPPVAGVLWYMLPVRMPAPVEMPARQLDAFARGRKQQALRPADMLAQLSKRPRSRRARGDGNALTRRSHFARGEKAEIDLGRVRATVTRADLAALPPDERRVAVRDLAENLFDAALQSPLLVLEIGRASCRERV